MTYDALERSNYSAIPTALYEFRLGSHSWCYATGDKDIVFNGKTYEAIAITDDGITQSGETSGDELVITIDERAEVNELFIGSPPSEQILVTLRYQNYGENEAPVQWVGTLKSNRRKSLGSREIRCGTLTSSLDRLGLRLSWGRGCPHSLYDRACAVDPNEFAITSKVISANGVVLEVEGLGDYASGYFTGGYVEFVHIEGAFERVAIESHAGTTLNMLGTVERLAVDQMVTVYPGCDRVSSTCEGKFNNLSNYGGFPSLPTKSPFDGDPIF